MYHGERFVEREVCKMCAKSDIRYSLIEAAQKVATIQSERESSVGSNVGSGIGSRTDSGLGSSAASGLGSSPGDNVSNSDAVYVAKSMTLREDQYMDITSLAAYNKLLRRKPDSVSAVVREAIDQYLSVTDDSYRYIGK